MITSCQGDILQANAQALVNTVNCVGVMGRGIALQFRQAYPDNFRAYAQACKRAAVVPGQVFIHPTGQRAGPAYIINFPTKRHWRDPSRLDDIEAGLISLVAAVERLGIRSIAIPPLGCGLGGLDWAVVRPRIAQAFARLPEVAVFLYEPIDAAAPPPRAVALARPRMTPGRAVLIGLMDQYLRGLMEPWVTLLEVHKLLYFAQAAGEPLRLRFVQAPYGPYAENLRHVLVAIEGHFISGYDDGGDQPEKPLELLPPARDEALRCLEAQPASRARFTQVVELVEGFETPFGMELLASVHWVAAHGAQNPTAATQALHAWNARKRQFHPGQVALAFDRLRDQGWLSPRD